MITLNQVLDILLNACVLLWDIMLIALLFIAMAILVTGTFFVFRTAYRFWFDGKDLLDLPRMFLDTFINLFNGMKNTFEKLGGRE